jgi:hypothetical protein
MGYKPSSSSQSAGAALSGSGTVNGSSSSQSEGIVASSSTISKGASSSHCQESVVFSLERHVKREMGGEAAFRLQKRS